MFDLLKAVLNTKQLIGKLGHQVRRTKPGACWVNRSNSTSVNLCVYSVYE